MTNLKHKLLASCSLLLLVVSVQFVPHVLADPSANGSMTGSTNTTISTTITTSPHCGGGTEAVNTSINIGCTGTGNPISDALFAIIRFLSAGVGLVIVGSLIVGGIQYSASRGDPQSTAKALGRMRSTMVALIIFIFGYAILNYVIPGGFLHP